MRQNIGESARKFVRQRDKDLLWRPASKIGLLAVLLVVVCVVVLAAHWPVAPAAGNDELANQIRKQLELYRQNIKGSQFKRLISKYETASLIKKSKVPPGGNI